MSTMNRRQSFFGAPKAPAPSEPVTDDKTAKHQSVIATFREHISRGMPFNLDHTMLAGVIDAVRHTEAIDDRKLLLEHVLVFLSRLPEGPMAQKLANSTVELLYYDLPHPPSTYIGNKYAWRSADGGGNNVQLPDLGRAGTPYARSVQQSHALPRYTLPDAGLVFDTLLKRDGFVKHPAGLSSLMFSFAALVIHSVFRTSHTDVNINETSSYVDLSPLYGNSQAQQDKLRVRDGRGLLFPDTFAEDRLLLLPPAVCVILVLFSRNHNYIAKKLLEINERGTFVDPSTLSSEDPKKNDKLIAQEEEIFQTARLINCGWFGSVVFSDYFSCILGLVREGSSWSLNPFGSIRNEDHSLFERGAGNVCSVEFNCLYRWHATTSAEDEKWIEDIFGQIFKGKTPESLTVNDFMGAAKTILATEPDIQHWTFGRLQRQEDGSFKDSELAGILMNSTDHPAAAFRARGTPAVMRLHEIMGIESNRRWGVCSLNDFRRFLGLKPYGSFLEWNPDPEIADAAEKLYGDIEHLELYVGLQAEEAKPVVDGAGLCPGYTISRAILSDAIALTRGDRFFTADYTPFNLTAWGFNDCQRTPSGFGFGSKLGALFLRTLPNDYSKNSVYTWFPLMTPDSMKKHLTKLNVVSKYDVARPIAKSPVVTVSDYTEIAQVLKDTTTFKTPYAERAAKVIRGNGFFLADPDPAKGQKEQQEVIAALSGSENGVVDLKKYFFEKTKSLIALHSYKLVGGKVAGVDVVRDVLNYITLHWAATELAGIPIKTKDNPHGAYTEQELYDILGDIYEFIFYEVDESKVMVLQDKVTKNIEELTHHIKANFGFAKRLSIAGFISSMFVKPKRTESGELIRKLGELGHNSDYITNAILAILVGTVELSITLTNAVNLFLDSDKEAQIQTLSQAAELDDQLSPYVYEALRIDPPFRGVYREATKAIVIGSKNIAEGQRVFLDIAAVHMNEQLFPKPQAIDPTRPKERYLGGDVLSKTLGNDLTAKIIAQVLHALFSFPGLRRAPGQSGQLTRFHDSQSQLVSWAYLDKDFLAAPWPTSLAVQYDVKTT